MKFVTTEAVMTALCQHCDSHIEMCEECPMRKLMPKEGEWLDEQRGRWIYAKCNLCGKVQDVRSNYCPNCGAKMKGANDADN